MSDTSLVISVSSTVARMQSNYFDKPHSVEGTETRRALAELRQSASRGFGTDPLALQRVLMLLKPPLSESLIGKTDTATPSESAVYHALTLFALHMQSAKHPAHSAKTSFAMACGQLYVQADSGSIKMRFDAMQAAADETARIVHLRSLIALLRSHNIAFDYGWFANDLRSLRLPQRRDGVLLRWGRDFAVGTMPPKKRHDTDPSLIEKTLS
ncbi:type I-E CRISPR-associated protein Cse2/CasB [Corynebacterium aquatimens]|uniref:CRISPR system Cascade subunit CasB n=1 Tax=Corynebacterium aquatimens TaxID=1190508 RepID=A0A931E2W5_9CORY|nr:type I-E CRISPR-associated protein Cse2/CasB [Corynebacterium aquatimens]MBG6123248.1 CRISPR system Cascade subunit CasB [Corynebacterium aquatimens]WJY66423.1 CRISPR-associated protein Cse2 [Corynebacterium aquatimens]